MADLEWTVVEEEDSYDEAGDHVGVFVIEHDGPGRPTLAGMMAAVNTKLRALGVPPGCFKSANAVLSLKTREVWYYKSAFGDAPGPGSADEGDAAP